MFRSTALCIITLLSGLVNALEVRPEVNGTLDANCRPTNSCAMMGNGSNATGAVPNGFYTPLFNVTDGMRYVNVQDLAIVDSAGAGLRIGDNSHHIIIDRVEVGYVANTPMWTRRNANQLMIKNSSFHHGTICHHWHKKPSDHAQNPAAPDVCESGGTSLVVLAQSQPDGVPANIIFMNNDVYTGSQEGVGMFDTESIWVVGNRVRNNRTAEIIVDHGHDNVLESNICWDYDNSGDTTMGLSYWGTRPEWGTRCLSVTMEDFYNQFSRRTHPNVVRNNIVAGDNIDYDVWPSFGADNRFGDEGGAQIYGNTVIGGAIYARGAKQPTANYELQIVGNIVYNQQTEPCNVIAPSTFEVFRMSNNFWGVNPANGNCDGSGDLYGKPNLQRDADTWGESYWTAANGPTYADAALKPGSPGLNAGVPLEGRLSFLNSLDWDYFAQASYPFSPNASRWELQMGYDFNGRQRSSSPNIGANESN